MIDDLVKSFKATLYERVISPLFGAFILSWCLWNWKILVLLFFGNDETASLRIEHIEQIPYLSAWFGYGYYGLDGGITHLLILPLLSALFFIFVYPYPNRWVYAFSKSRAEELIKLKNEIEKKTPVPQDKYDKLVLQVNEKERETVSLLEERNSTISALDRENKELKDKIFELNKKVVEVEENYNNKNIENTPPKIIREIVGGSDSGNVQPAPTTTDEEVDVQTKWREEFLKLKSSGVLDDFGKLIMSIYDENDYFEPSLVAKYDALGLIERDDIRNRKNQTSYILSDKGMFFSELFHKGEEAELF